jgi:hypothetical protein
VKRLPPHLIDADAAAPGDVLAVDPTTGNFTPGTPAPSGVQTIVAGTNVTVDATDPLHPIVAATGPRELLMADGVTSPPVPIETEAGDDWLYQD